ncbi:MAG: hypothetical protein FJX76_04845 [Armatimonadetes bacterium]|nr:hypothetical protein [Armatimonadota bacterium]
MRIPTRFNRDEIRASVRVRFDISASGSCQAFLMTSTGNVDLDSYLLGQLSQFHWQPALEEGEPVQSVERYRVDLSN